MRCSRKHCNKVVDSGRPSGVNVVDTDSAFSIQKQIIILTIVFYLLYCRLPTAAPDASQNDSTNQGQPQSGADDRNLYDEGDDDLYS